MRVRGLSLEHNNQVSNPDLSTRSPAQELLGRVSHLSQSSVTVHVNDLNL